MLHGGLHQFTGTELLHEAPGRGFCPVFINKNSKEFIQREKGGTTMLKTEYTKNTSVFSKHR